MAEKAKDERLWSAQDVADFLNLPVGTVYAWRSTGGGPPGRRLGKRLRYRPADVRAWLEALPTDVWAS